MAMPKNPKEVPIQLISPDERMPIRLGAATFYTRRLTAAREMEILLATAAPADANEAALKRAHEAQQAALLDEVLVDWENVLGEDGQPNPPCTTENKAMLPPGVRRELIATARIALHAKGNREEVEASEAGNLPGSSSL